VPTGQESASEGSRNCVLVVDGEHAICSFVTSVLDDIGYSVVCAASGAEARRMARRPDILCALIEVVLPDGWGDDVAADVARLSIPAILMSGHPEGVQRGRTSRFVFMRKPFGVQDLIRAILDQALAGLSRQS
jgi:DNA-binding NtrC family response regulator